MKNKIFAAAMIAAASTLAAPASLAQDRPPPVPVEGPVSYTAEDDLDCAIFLAEVIGSSGNSLTASQQTGLNAAFAYFIGRYEKENGLTIQTALVARQAAYEQRDRQALSEMCIARMTDFGERLQQVGNATSAKSPGETGE